MNMKHKSFTGLKITNEDQGEVEAVFATLGVKDLHGDVTLKGAFKSGEEVRLSAYNHESWKGALPVGKGTIEEVGDNVVFKGRFFMDTTGGKDTFHTVKEMGGLQEWSYGYETLDQEPGQKDGEQVNIIKSQKVHEVSPVLQGAGIGTQTTAVKQAEKDNEELETSPETEYSGLKFSDHVEKVLADISELSERTSSVVALRAEKGKENPLSASAEPMVKELSSHLETLNTYLKECNANDNDVSADLDRIELDLLANQLGVE